MHFSDFDYVHAKPHGFHKREPSTRMNSPKKRDFLYNKNNPKKIF